MFKPIPKEELLDGIYYLGYNSREDNAVEIAVWNSKEDAFMAMVGNKLEIIKLNFGNKEVTQTDFVPMMPIIANFKAAYDKAATNTMTVV